MDRVVQRAIFGKGENGVVHLEVMAAGSAAVDKGPGPPFAVLRCQASEVKSRYVLLAFLVDVLFGTVLSQVVLPWPTSRKDRPCRSVLVLGYVRGPVGARFFRLFGVGAYEDHFVGSPADTGPLVSYLVCGRDVGASFSCVRLLEDVVVGFVL